MNQPFVAVHVGAGFHSDANSKDLKTLCKKACKEAMVALMNGSPSNEAIVQAISILENSPQTNAGYGSNLSLSGSVECDASIMDGHGNFGAVGAVEGVVNPIKLAHTLLRESSQGCLPLGRVPPLVLVGDGACSWARQHEIETCSSNDLITDRARAVYLDHMTRLEGVTQQTVYNGPMNDKMGDGLVSRNLGDKHLRCHDTWTEAPHKIQRLHKDDEDDKTCTPSNTGSLIAGITPYRPPIADQPPTDVLRPPISGTISGGTTLSCRAPLDTVGAICLDMKGEAGAGVSSGGISLKSPGRVGQAAMFGCGCWADDDVGGSSRAVACSTSGTGEYIIKTSLAKECALEMVDSSLHRALDKHFLNSKRLKNVDQKLAGAIVLNFTTDDILHFSWGHTTESMCIGFMGGNDKDPTAIISKMDNPEKSGTVSHVQAMRITI